MKIKYPVGYPIAGRTKIAVNFPTAMFQDIIKRAKYEKKTFNDMVVELCKVGAFDLDESDRYEHDVQPNAPPP